MIAHNFQRIISRVYCRCIYTRIPERSGHGECFTNHRRRHISLNLGLEINYRSASVVFPGIDFEVFITGFGVTDCFLVARKQMSVGGKLNVAQRLNSSRNSGEVHFTRFDKGGGIDYQNFRFCGKHIQFFVAVEYFLYRCSVEPVGIGLC